MIDEIVLNNTHFKRYTGTFSDLMRDFENAPEKLSPLTVDVAIFNVIGKNPQRVSGYFTWRGIQYTLHNNPTQMTDKTSIHIGRLSLERKTVRVTKDNAVGSVSPYFSLIERLSWALEGGIWRSSDTARKKGEADNDVGGLKMGITQYNFDLRNLMVQVLV